MAAEEVTAAAVFQLRADGSELSADLAQGEAVAARFERAMVQAFNRVGAAASKSAEGAKGLAPDDAATKRFVTSTEREILALEKKTAAMTLTQAAMKQYELSARGVAEGISGPLVTRMNEAEQAVKSMTASIAQAANLKAFDKLLTDSVALGQVSKNIDGITASLEKLQGVERELAETRVFEARATEAAKLNKAADYVHFWATALDAADKKEKELADFRAFDTRLNEAAKLNKAADYVQFWNSSLDIMEAKERELAAVPLFEKERAAAEKLRRTADATAAFTELLDKMEAEEKKLAADTSFIDSLQRRAVAIGKTQSELLELEAAQRGLSTQAAPHIAALRDQEKALGVYSGTMRDARVSANQLKTGLAQLPMQFTDIFTSLAGGQNPMLVFIQQGGQIRDSFGGVGNALRAVASVISPMAAAIGGAAAVIGTLGLAYKQGSAEADEYRKALVLTGNAAGSTVGQLAGVAVAVSNTVGTQGKAAEAIAQLAATGRVAAGDIGKLAEAAIRLEREGGPAVKETVKAFADLAKDPSKAVQKLNEETNFLTVGLYKQIVALQERGRADEAASIAQNAYAEAVKARAKELETSLGGLEKAWRFVGEGAKWAWDRMLNIGRPDTLEDQLRKAQTAVEALNAPGRKSQDPVRDAQRKAAAQQLVEELRLQILQATELAQAEADLARATEKGIVAIDKQREAAKKAAEEFKKLAEAGKELVLGELAKAGGFDPKLGDQIEKVSAAYKTGAITADQMHLAMSRIMDAQPYMVERNKAEQEAIKELDDALEASAKARLDLLKLSDKETDAAAKRVESLRKETDALRDRLAEELGGKRAKEENQAMRTAEQIRDAIAEANAATFDMQPPERVALLWEQVDALKEQLGLHKQIAQAATNKEIDKANERILKDWEKTSDSIRDGLTDAFRRAFESGEDFGTAMAKTIEREIKSRIATALSSLLAEGVMMLFGLGDYRAGASNGVAGGRGSMWQSAGSLFSTGSSAYSLYNSSGSAASTYEQFVAGYRGSSASMGAGTVGPVTDGAAGATGAGASASGAMSTIGPYAIAAIAYAIGADQMADWSLHLGGYSEARRGGVRNIAAEIPGSNQLDADTIAGMSAQGVYIPSVQQLSDGMATALFSFADKFATSIKATSPIEATQVVFESDRANDSWGQVKFLGSGNRELSSTGMLTDLNWDANVAAPQLITRSAGAFAAAMQDSDAADWVKASLAKIPAELEKITPDIIKQFDDPLQQAQAVNQALAGMLDGISATFAQLDQLDEQLGSLGGAFGQLAEMSSDARNALVLVFGGMEQFQRQIGSYVSNYYTEAERAALTTKQLGDTLATVGLQLPTTREGFRALVDSVAAGGNLLTESGRGQFATLMSVADAFAAITPAARSAADILSERKDLEKQLLEVQGDSAAIRALERAEIDKSNLALYDQIQALKDLQAVAAARNSALDKLLTPEQNTAREYSNIQLDLSKAGVNLDVGQLIGASKDDLLAFATAFEGVETNSAGAKIAVWAAAGALADLKDEAAEAAANLGAFKSDFASIDFNIISDELINNVAELSGGFGTLTSNVQTYFDEFMTEAERGANGAQSLALKLRDVGIEVPNTVEGLQTLGRDGFKGLVQAAVGSGNAGALGALLSVSGMFAELVPSAEDAAEAMGKVVDALKAAVSEAMQTLVNTVNVEKGKAKVAFDFAENDPVNGFGVREFRARQTHKNTIDQIEIDRKAFGDNGTGALRGKIDAERLSEMYRRRGVEDELIRIQAKIDEAAKAFAKAMDAIADKIKTQTEEVNRLTALSNSLHSTIDNLRPMGAERFDRQQAQQQIREALETARKTGALPKADDLRNALSVIQRPSEGMFATQADYLRDFNKTLNDVTALSDITDGQLDVATQQLTALEAIRDLMERSQFASGPEAEALKASLKTALGDYNKLTNEDLGDSLDLFAGFEVGANTALKAKIEGDDAILTRASQRRIEDWTVELEKKQVEFNDFLDGLNLRRDAADTTLDTALAGIAADRQAAKLAYDTEIERLDKIIEDNQKLVDEALGLNKTATSIDAAINDLKEKLADLAELKNLSTTPTALDGIAAALNGLPAGIAAAVAGALAGINIGGPGPGTGPGPGPGPGTGTGTGTVITATPVEVLTAINSTVVPGASLNGTAGEWVKGLARKWADQRDYQAGVDLMNWIVSNNIATHDLEAALGLGWTALDSVATPTAFYSSPTVVQRALQNIAAEFFNEGAPNSGNIDLAITDLKKGGKHTSDVMAYLSTLPAFAGYSAQSLGIPQFAFGGMHDGGARLVGERGPELEVTGPARYYSADQTMAMLRSPDRANDVLVGEVRRLNAKIESLEAILAATAANTGKTARQLDRWDGDGMPDVRPA